MANLTITNISNSSVIIADAVHVDGIIKFPGADDYLEGTIMARKTVSDTVAVVADAGNTGDGTVVAAPAAGDAIPLAGAYVLTCVVAVVNGGIFKLEDPNGNLVASDLSLTVGAGAATDFVAGGLAFTITDGATDFAAADFFTLTVAADGDFVIFAENGVGGAQIPSAVLTYDVSSAALADVAGRLMVSGRVRRDKLIIDAGGTVTDAIVDKLRDYGLVAETVTELQTYDNQ